ncbi:MAG: hypothetical protein HQK57_06915 [Deltaproteobacteria bacterium]|nr:hypothetical protein [Deltaproteobacteria bacterium]MBF0526016.1 hypothetical protein [Deltaproteobacteria bacterium]
MLNQDNASVLMGKRLQDIANRVASQLQARKIRDVLDHEISKSSRAAEHLKDKLTIVRTRLTETLQSIAGLEPRLKEPRQTLAQLEEERQRAEIEYLRLKDLEKDLEAKLEHLPQVRSEVIKRRQEVRKAKAEFESLQISLQNNVTQKSQLEAEVKSLQARFQRLSEEIPMLRNVRDMILGQKPEGMNEATFREIQPNLDTSVADYSHDVAAQVEQIEQELAELNKRMDQRLTVQKQHQAEVAQRQQMVAELKAGLGIEVSSEMIQTELDALEDQKQTRLNQLEAGKVEMVGLKADLQEIDAQLAQARETEEKSKKRLAHLNSVKQDMGRIDNLVQEIERLADETNRLEMRAEVNTGLHEIVQQVEEKVESVHHRLQSAFENNQKFYHDLYQELIKPLAY